MQSIGFGQRISIPESTGFAKSPYREMRRVGIHPDCLPIAVILGFLECAKAPQEPRYGRAKGRFPAQIDNTVFGYPGEETTRSEMCRILISDAFASSFSQSCDEFLQQHEISTKTNAALSNIQSLAELLKIKIDLRVNDMNQDIGFDVSGSVGIGVFRGYCFVLYEHYTMESFITLPCGHLQLRFKLMESVQKAANSTTIADTTPLPIKVCEECSDSYNPETMFSILSNTAKGQYEQSLSTPEDPSFFVCSMCCRKIEAQEISPHCNCCNTICVNCMLRVRFTARPNYCPKCAMKLTAPESLDQIIGTLHNVRDLKRARSSGYKSKPRLEKACFKCSAIYPFSEFQEIGDHVNCWVCKKCLSVALVENEQSTCPRCSLELDTTIPGIALILQSARERNRKPEEEKKESTLAATSDSAEIPEGREDMSEVPDPLKAINTECEVCKEQILGTIIKLPDEKCRVCLKCLRQYRHTSRCACCNRSYSREDKEKLNSGLLDIQERNETAVCLKCKQNKPIFKAHHCRDKYKCSECCTDEIIATFTSKAGRCRDCQAQYVDEIQADFETCYYPCNVCGSVKKLLEVAHVCNGTATCFSCMNPKNGAFKCTKCNSTLQYKFWKTSGKGSIVLPH